MQQKFSTSATNRVQSKKKNSFSHQVFTRKDTYFGILVLYEGVHEKLAQKSMQTQIYSLTAL